MEALELLTHKGARPLFETLQTYPRRQFSINALSKTAKLPFTSTWKLVQKFERAHIVDVTPIGKSRVVQYQDTPYSKLVATILRMSVSTQALSLPELKRILREKEAVKEAYLFGSVAIKKEKLESDIDVALRVSKRIDITSFMSSMLDKYGVKVIPLTFDSKDEFDDFLQGKKTVKLK